MKQILNYLKTHYISLCIIVLLILLIWLRGPELTIGYTTPLQSEEQRFCAILLILLALFLKFIFIDTKGIQSAKKRSSLDTEKKLKHLYGKFHGAIAFLKKTILNKQGKDINLLRL